MRIYTPPNATLVPEDAEKVFEGEIFDVYQWPQKMFDGTTKTFEMIKRPDTVQIIAIDGDQIVLSKEQQPHTGTFLSLPSGMHDVPSESELEAAKRELVEETGYVCNRWKLIGCKQPSNKIEQIIYTFLATDVAEVVEQSLDSDGESIKVERLSFQDFKKSKHDPLTKFFPAEIVDELNSLEELLALPALHNYENQD